MEADLKRLRELHRQLWKKASSGRPHYHESWWPVQRVLNSEERKFLYKCIVKYNLLCTLRDNIIQGVGMVVAAPCEMSGEQTYPGVTYSASDTKHVITITDDHIFDDSPIEYRYRTWCKEKKGIHIVDLSYRFFTAIVGRKQNLEMLERYNIRGPHIPPVDRFHY